MSFFDYIQITKAHLAVLSLVVLGTIHAGADVCFEDVASYQAAKAELPAILQSYPIYAVHQSFELTGGFEIVAVGPKLQIEAHVRPLIGKAINASALVTKACVSGNELQAVLADGTTDTITLNSNSITIKGFDFTLTNQSTYQGVISKVQGSELDSEDGSEETSEDN